MLRPILPILIVTLLVGCAAPPRPPEPKPDTQTAAQSTDQTNEDLKIPAPATTQTTDQTPTTQETKTLKSGQLTLTVTLEHFAPRASDQEGLWGGLPSYTSKIKKITAQWGDEEDIPVPHSAYSDLMDPQNLKLDPSGTDSFTLKIDNPNPAAPYNAVLNFHEEYLTKRVVKDGEFPDQFNETTIYTTTPVED